MRSVPASRVCGVVSSEGTKAIEATRAIQMQRVHLRQLNQPNVDPYNRCWWLCWQWSRERPEGRAVPVVEYRNLAAERRGEDMPRKPARSDPEEATMTGRKRPPLRLLVGESTEDGDEALTVGERVGDHDPDPFTDLIPLFGGEVT